MNAESPASGWAEAILAASLFALDPAGLGGVCLRAPAGAVRDRWMSEMRRMLPPAVSVRRMPANISDDRLLGGLDLAATLQSSRPIVERGLLAQADGGILVLAMAERLRADTVARLAAVLDAGEVRTERDGLALCDPAHLGIVAFDESLIDEERPRAALLDRLSFLLSLEDVGVRDTAEAGPGCTEIARARDRLAFVAVPDPMLNAICGTALALGIGSIRPSLLSVRAARGLAALAGRDEVSAEDAALAVRLTLAPRATQIPAVEAPQDEQAASEPSAAPEGDDKDQTTGNPGEAPAAQPDEGADQPLGEMVLAAAAASIPAGLLRQLKLGAAGPARTNPLGRGGAVQFGMSRHGRPAGVRQGEVGPGARLALVDTLRAAAPWQRLRRTETGAPPGRRPRIEIRRDDIRIAKTIQRTGTTTIFAVDASGSSALNRLAEAKGAVELLLAECYVRRDRVALVAFRGREAELLLPPTRSLVRAKRCLANLPGGGGTPLAAGLDAAATLAATVRRQGAVPIVVLMTDGHANVARGGKLGRGPADADAQAAARAIREAGIAALLVDISPRPHPLAARLAADMGAAYLLLPSADAQNAVSLNVRELARRSRPDIRPAA